MYSLCNLPKQFVRFLLIILFVGVRYWDDGVNLIRLLDFPMQRAGNFQAIRGEKLGVAHAGLCFKINFHLLLHSLSNVVAFDLR